MDERPFYDFALAIRRAHDSAALFIQETLASEAGRSLRELAETWNDVGPELIERLAYNAEHHQKALDRAIPPNWRDLTYQQIFQSIELMHGVGWSLIGAPSSAVVEELLAAPTPQHRRAVLLGAAPEITDYVENLLSMLLKTEHAPCADAALEALACYWAGHHRAAQALTTAALTTTLHEHMRSRSHTAVRNQFLAAQAAQGELADFRWIALQGAVAKVLEPYDPLMAPPRSDYVRNASAHWVRAPQYSSANALSSLMLITSLMDELHRRSQRNSAA